MIITPNMNNSRNTNDNANHRNRSSSVKSCRKFLRMDVKRHEKFVEDRRYCINCLARSHDWRACPSMNRCRKCDAFHYTLLHPKRQSVITKQLRQRVTRANQPISLQQPTTPTQTNTQVITEAIKSLAVVLCASG